MFRAVKIILSIVVLCFVANAAPAAIFASDESTHDIQQAEIYTCPMHPQVVSDKPGECPICHMRLVLRRRQSISAGFFVEGRAPISVSEMAQKEVGIQTQPVESRSLKKTINVWGAVAHDSELYALQIEFLRQESLNYQREKSKTLISQERGISEREKIAIKFLDMGLSHDWIKALADAGVPDKRLLFHDSTQGIWVYVELREQDAPLVKKGNMVRLAVPALPGVMMDGEVKFIDGKVNDMTGTIRARVLVDKIPDGLKPMMRVSGTIPVDMGESIVISQEAPLFTGKGAMVFVEEKGNFSAREVVLGSKVDGYYEVKEGLVAGEKIVARGNFFVDSESRLQFSAADQPVHESHTS